MYYSTNDKCFIEFKKDMQNIKMLLDAISDDTSCQVQINIVGEKTFICNGEAILSAIHTIDSIIACTEIGSFSDSFTLARKFRDDLTQYLFICDTLNNVSGFNKQEIDDFNIDEMDTETFTHLVEDLSKILSSGLRKNEEEKAIDAWFENVLSDENYKNMRRNFFDTSKYIETLRKNTLVDKCYCLYLADIWEKTNRIFNNYVHTNGIKYITANLPQYTYAEREIYLVQLFECIETTASTFLCFIILLKPSLITSDDYIDFLENGITPPSDSQYWINGHVQEYIDKYIVRINPNLKKFLQDSNPYGMIIE